MRWQVKQVMKTSWSQRTPLDEDLTSFHPISIAAASMVTSITSSGEAALRSVAVKLTLIQISLEAGVWGRGAALDPDAGQVHGGHRGRVAGQAGRGGGCQRSLQDVLSRNGAEKQDDERQMLVGGALMRRQTHSMANCDHSKIKLNHWEKPNWVRT